MGLCIYCEYMNYYKRKSETEAYCPLRRQYYEVNSLGCFEYEESHLSAMACHSENERGIQKWRGNENSDCFITTTVCQILKKEDNCFELKTLRYLRDSYMLKDENYVKLLLEYYQIGPTISNCLLKEESPKKRASILYDFFIDKAVSFTVQGYFEEACRLYIEMVTYLKRLYHLENLSYDHSISYEKLPKNKNELKKLAKKLKVISE